MKHLVRVTALLFCHILFVMNANANTNGYDVEIILDVSGSMRGLVDGKPKIDIAKQAVGDLVRALPKETLLGFRAYGHQFPREENNCTDTALLSPINKVDQTQVLAQLASLKPNGYTPIEYSLLQAKNDFPSTSELGKMVILISDGKETCGGDPCKAVKELNKSGFNIVINAVGFDVDNEAKSQLECIAKVSGGEYRDARNASELTDSLEIFANRAKRDYTETGDDVEPGTGFNNAKQISAGEYKADIVIDEGHFYKFDVSPGQKLVAVANLRPETKWSGTGLCFRSFNIELFDKYKRKIGNQSGSVNGSDGEQKTLSIETRNPLKAGTYVMKLYAQPRVNSGPGKNKKLCKEMIFAYELGLYLEGPQEE